VAASDCIQELLIHDKSRFLEEQLQKIKSKLKCKIYQISLHIQYKKFKNEANISFTCRAGGMFS